MDLDRETLDRLIELAREHKANREELPPITPLIWLLNIQNKLVAKHDR